MRRTTRAQRRDEIERLLSAEPERSNRDVAREVGSDHKTVGRVRGELERAGAIPARLRQPQAHGGALLAAENGNSRTVKHGVDSEARLAPLRIEGEAFARGRWPWLDDARVALVADLTARVELARRWIEARGTVVRNRSGDVFPVVDRLERWSARLDALIRQLDVEARERERVDPYEALEAHLAEIAESNGADS